MPLHHLGFIVQDLKITSDFYAAALKPLGYEVAITFADGEVIGFGAGKGPDFFLSGPNSPAGKKAAEAGTGSTGFHLAFAARNREEVRQFHAAAIAAGGKDNGEPGPREHYAPGYYGAFIIDPEGRNIEAVYIGPDN
ncbi:hypothetical protein D9613_003981 [Agrocybe pediades]|uniref:VOC domain-containing protein n=1 Tax=Agrocybe pediades TaxID=84607 RepID=A0A8H4QIA4_9AGAR|nr:hypothetical protein D9613_003981 [Agrocybe pediades]